MKKIYKEIVEACYYCPANSCDGWSNESVCLESKPHKFFKGMYMKGFPKWCPLEDYKSANN